MLDLDALKDKAYDELIKIYSPKFNWTYKLQNGTSGAIKSNTLTYLKSEDLHNAEIKIII